MGCGSSSSSAAEAGGKAGEKPMKDRPKSVLEAKMTSTNEQAAGKESQVDVLRQTCLDAHNEKRALHGAPPLTLSRDLNNMAQNWADTLAKKGTFEHSKGREDAGENLAAHSHISNDSGQVITNMWYDEIKVYDFNKQGFSMATGHFTQVVWKSTAQLGVGVAKNEKMGMYVFVANYRPPGNMMGSFEQNVQEP